MSIRTDTGARIDAGWATLPKDTALLIYKLYNGAGMPELQAYKVLQAIEKAEDQLARGERNFTYLLDTIKKAVLE